MSKTRNFKLFFKIIGARNYKLDREDYIHDFNFSYNVLEKYYPYFRVNKEVNNIDWLGKKETYLQRISELEDDIEFFDEMNLILSELNNDHTSLLDSYFVDKLYEGYSFLDPSDWRYSQSKIFEDPLVQMRYFKGKRSFFPKFLRMESKSYSKNLSFFDLIEDRIAYISIKSMLNLNRDLNYEYEDQKLNNYLDRIRDYQALVLDIRDNKGGDSDYWSEYFLPKIIDRDYGHSAYSFIKKGELLEDFARQESFKEIDSWILDMFKDQREVLDYIADFDLYKIWTNSISPNNDSIRFKGRIYLLVNERVFSSADKLAVFAKDTGFARVLGERTAGDGIATDPIFLKLPRSGYILRFPKELGLSEKAIINEKYGTEPDILIEDASKRLDFFQSGEVFLRSDYCIKKVLELEEYS